MSDPDYEILAFEARTNEADDIQVLLPPIDNIDAVLGTEKWLVRQAEDEALELNEATQMEMVGVDGRSLVEDEAQGNGCTSSACGDKGLEW